MSHAAISYCCLLHSYSLALEHGDGHEYRYWLDHFWYQLTDDEKETAPKMPFRTIPCTSRSLTLAPVATTPLKPLRRPAAHAARFK